MWYDESVLVGCGIDWFTSTSRDAAVTRRLLVKAEGLYMRENSAGGNVRPWKMYGYTGWRVGRLEYGWREDGGIIRLSGGLADSEWWDVWQITQRCTRIDLQATVRVKGRVEAAVASLRRSCAKFYKNRTDGPKRTQWTDNTGGATFYLGSRQSALYFRAYNKAAQSQLPEFENCLRLELEVKGAVCRNVITALCKADFVKAGVLGLLSQYLEARGILTNFPAVNPCSFYEQSSFVTDAQKTLEWLRIAVRPSVNRLIEEGYGAAVAECLGLPVKE
jgi:DNA relaxase NicK